MEGQPQKQLGYVDDSIKSGSIRAPKMPEPGVPKVETRLTPEEIKIRDRNFEAHRARELKFLTELLKNNEFKDFNIRDILENPKLRELVAKKLPSWFPWRDLDEHLKTLSRRQEN